MALAGLEREGEEEEEEGEEAAAVVVECRTRENN